jgi:hypothetical protein
MIHHSVLALLLVAVAMPAAACGDVRIWTESYFNATATDHNRRTALQELAGVCGTYGGPEDDRRLVAVLSDADRRGYDRALLKRVFESYRCLAGAPEPSERDRLALALGANCL